MGVWSSSGPHCGSRCRLARLAAVESVGFQVIGSLFCAKDGRSVMLIVDAAPYAAAACDLAKGRGAACSSGVPNASDETAQQRSTAIRCIKTGWCRHAALLYAAMSAPQAEPS